MTIASENNLFLVKRLVQRVDMRSPDPSSRRLTSLAWAALLANEETFEFLLAFGHDDEDISRVRLVLYPVWQLTDALSP
jgi:hypothetical protein